MILSLKIIIYQSGFTDFFFNKMSKTNFSLPCFFPCFTQLFLEGCNLSQMGGITIFARNMFSAFILSLHIKCWSISGLPMVSQTPHPSTARS